MAKRAGQVAYEHYLATGTVYGMFEGAVQRGDGRPPRNPMTFDEFLAKSRSIPKPSQDRDAKGWDGVKRWMDR